MGIFCDILTLLLMLYDFRENKEVNNLISVLDNTLHIDKDDEEEELQEVKVTDETPRIPKSSSMPSIIEFEIFY